MKITEQIRMYYENWSRLDYAYRSLEERLGVSHNELFTLYHLREEGGACSQKKLAEDMYLTKQTMSFIVARLEKRGFVEKRTEERDRRNNAVAFTEEGRVRADRLLEEMARAETAAYLCMTEDERTNVTEGLKILADNIEKSFGIKRLNSGGKTNGV